MPTLEFKGKQFVYSHHLGVPFRELQVVPEKSLPAEGKQPSLDDNLIIHGDNLEALKALLPTHAGKVDCIFIDPPYNTGNEGWCYNDNVRSPLMKEWLKKLANPVDKEDLERHDKWLCMMWPRMHLLKDLLAETGSIWITLDDNEAHRFKLMMDEVFGEENFICSIAWQKMYTVKNSARHFSEMHDQIFVYAKSEIHWTRNLLSRSDDATGSYTNPDSDPRGVWATNAIQARNFYSQGEYEIVSPSGRKHTPPKGTYWRISKSTFDELNSDGRIWWGLDGNSIPRIKKYLSESKDGVVPSTLWTYRDAGSNASAKEHLRDIVADLDDSLFNTPKPVELLDKSYRLPPIETHWCLIPSQALAPQLTQFSLPIIKTTAIVASFSSSAKTMPILSLRNESAGSSMATPIPVPSVKNCIGRISPGLRSTTRSGAKR
jgi:adenine-specific DNA-methyltransferase